VIQLTDNVGNDERPQIHDGQVVWWGSDGSDYEVFLYNGSSVIQLTDNSYDDWYPQIHGGQVVWWGYDGSDWEVFLYNGSSVIQLTSNSYDDYYPTIHGEQVVWYGAYLNGDDEIFLYDGSSVTQLTNNLVVENSPQIDDGWVTWKTVDAVSYQVPYYGVYLARPRKCEASYDSETGTFTTDSCNTLPLLLSIDGEKHTLEPGESYSESRTFVLSLTAGWNMVSLPFLPSDPSAQSVMSGAGFFQLVTWSGTSYVTATEFELGKGYWLLVLEDTNITITG